LQPACPQLPRSLLQGVYHAVKVVDNYRWLENFNDPAVPEWSDAQNRYARADLDRLPMRAALYERLNELRSYPSPRYFALEYLRNVLFAIKRQPPKEQPFLVTLRSPDDAGSEHVVLDPNQLDAKGTAAIDFYVPSADDKYVAMSLSHGGSESGDVHVYEVVSGKSPQDGRGLQDVVPRVNGGTAGGSVAWNSDSTGFYYTRYPRGSERPKVDLDSTSRSTFTGWARGPRTTRIRWAKIFRVSPRFRTGLQTTRDSRNHGQW